MFTELYSPSPWSTMKKGLVAAVLFGTAADAFQTAPGFLGRGMKLRSATSPAASVKMAVAAPTQSKFEAMRKKYSRFGRTNPSRMIAITLG